MMRRRAMGGLTQVRRFAEGGSTDPLRAFYDQYISQIQGAPDFDLFSKYLTPDRLAAAQSIDPSTYGGSGPTEGVSWDDLPDSDPLKVNHMMDVQGAQQAAAFGGYRNLGEVKAAQENRYTQGESGFDFMQKYLPTIAIALASYGIGSGIGALAGAAGGTGAGSAGGLSAAEGATAGGTAGATTGGTLGGLSSATIPEIVVTGAAPTAGGLTAGGLAGAGLGAAAGSALPSSGGLTQGGETDIPNITVTGNPVSTLPTGIQGGLDLGALGAMEPVTSMGSDTNRPVTTEEPTSQKSDTGPLSKIGKYVENPKNWNTLIKGGTALASLGAGSGSPGQAGPPPGWNQGNSALDFQPGPGRTTHFNDPESYYTYGSRGEENFFQPVAPTAVSSPAPTDPRKVYGGMPATGYNTGHLVRGPGTGRSDDIPARLSDGEYVMDAETVALLGDGSTDEGARKLDRMRANLRKQKGRELSKGKFSSAAKHPEQYLEGK
jgi:hypothetical protein